MGKYIMIAIAVVGIGYVIADDLIFSRTNATMCCANGFDAAPFETKPVRP